MVKLVFIHLPKTGGSTMLDLLNRNYGERHVRHFERDECLELNAKGKRISEVIGTDVQVIHGHFFYSEVKDIIKRDKPHVVTFMRDPVKRVISNYHWWMHTIERDENHSQRHRINESLAVYASQPDVRNKVSQFLAGSRLGTFTFIGFLESLQRDVERMAQLLGWQHVTLSHEKNSQSFKKKGQAEVEPELMDKIARLNRKDIRLYKKAKALKFRI